MKQLEHVSDITALIRKLGGLTEAARFFGETPQAVGNWRLRNQIPPRLYLQHAQALNAHGLSAPVELWGQNTATQPGRAA